MSGRARISVVLVSYRTGPVLLDTLRALGEDPDVADIVLVDNGNPSSERRAIHAALDATGKGRLLQGHGNVGFSRACNYGVRLARHDLIHFLNPDAVPERGASRRLAEAAEGLRAAWIAGGLLLDEAGREQRGARRGVLTPFSALGAYGPLRRVPGLPRFNRTDDPMPTGPVPMPTISGASFMMDRAGWKAVGGLDEGYFLHVEDVALCREVRRMGGTVLFVPSSRAVHERSSSDVPSHVVDAHKLAGFARFFRTDDNGLAGRVAAALLLPVIGAALAARRLVARLKS